MVTLISLQSKNTLTGYYGDRIKQLNIFKRDSAQCLNVSLSYETNKNEFYNPGRKRVFGVPLLMTKCQCDASYLSGKVINILFDFLAPASQKSNSRIVGLLWIKKMNIR